MVEEADSEPLVAVMLAVPTEPGVQTILLVSQVPAQTSPPAETVATLVLLEAKVIFGGLVTALPFASKTVAPTEPTRPASSEIVVGVITIDAGVGGGLLP